jgi:hypothetical protein
VRLGEPQGDRRTFVSVGAQKVRFSGDQVAERTFLTPSGAPLARSAVSFHRALQPSRRIGYPAAPPSRAARTIRRIPASQRSLSPPLKAMY